MTFILDTDHVSQLQYRTGGSDLLRYKVVSSPELFFTTAITLEEQTKGWISVVGRQTDVSLQVVAYERFVSMFRFFAHWQVLSFSQAAATEFKRLRQERVRIGTSDLKSASIALVENAVLLTANTRDFERVPGLRFENWKEQ